MRRGGNAACLLLALIAVLIGARAAYAVSPVNIRTDAGAIDLTGAIEQLQTETDRVQVSTAAGADGIVRRIEVRARDASTNWAVFALANTGDEQLERLIVAPHYRLVGSGLFWPDLGLSRIVAVTPSSGERPEAVHSAGADIFRIVLDPGAVITFVAELRTESLPQLYLWEPDAYKDKVNSLTLYHGIVIGIAGLLALLLTILFVVKGSLIFPAAAALAWAVLIYVGIDFGFWGKVFEMSAGAERVWRASGEAILSATLLVFLFAYLNLHRWSLRYAHLTLAWAVLLAGLVSLALYDPPVAAGIARMSLALVAIVGLMLVIYFSARGSERALMLIPTWLLLVAWILAAGLAVTAFVTNDIVGPALLGGLVLIVMLIGFTVMQHAFAGATAHGVGADIERRAMALTGAGDPIWDWDVSADKVFTSPETEQVLGLKRGTLEGPAAVWLDVLHPLDRARFRIALDRSLEQRRGRIVQDFRLRAVDGHYLWFTLKARPVVGSDGEVVRVIGTLTDVTKFRVAEERLLHDGVRDNLTGLPNRELFIDRLNTALILARGDAVLRPAVMIFDIDQFKQVNDAVGIATGDSILVTLARRLGRLLKPQDTLTRLSGNQFGLVLLSESNSSGVIAFAEAIRRTVRAPIAFNEREIVLTSSIGVVLTDGETQRGDDLVRNAALAMHHAKRLGGDRVEVFKPAMAGFAQSALHVDLQRALERQELTLVFRPIIRLEDLAVAGFEALPRWMHPKLAPLSADELMGLAEEAGVVANLGLFMIERTAAQLSAWQQAERRSEPLFASVSISSPRLLRHELVHDLRAVIGRTQLARGTLKIEVSEALVMGNPEHATRLLSQVSELGAGLVLAGFGAGQFSVAYLQRLPVDLAKIDSSIVRTAGAGARPAVLRSMIALARDLGMECIAEVAADDCDAIELHKLGCRFAHGLASGAVMTAEEAGELLGANRLLTAK